MYMLTADIFNNRAPEKQHENRINTSTEITQAQHVCICTDMMNAIVSY